MKTNFLIIIAGAALAYAGPTPTEKSAYERGMTYTGPITPGGPNHILHGTASEIHAQILKLNPRFNPEDFETTKAAAFKARRDQILQRRAAPTVAPPDGSHTNCNLPNFELVEWNNIAGDGGTLESVMRLPGDCTAPPGRPGAGGCIRVDCKRNADVAFCNDLPEPLTFPCHDAYAYAFHAASDCYGRERPGWTKGQTFSRSSSFNLIVKKADCA